MMLEKVTRRQGLKEGYVWCGVTMEHKEAFAELTDVLITCVCTCVYMLKHPIIHLKHMQLIVC